MGKTRYRFAVVVRDAVGVSSVNMTEFLISPPLPVTPVFPVAVLSPGDKIPY